MAEDDYAIVVGVSRYPNMQGNDLLGPDHDATDFADWLVNGGQVPKDHLHLKLYHSSGYDAKATPPEPTQFQVASDAFETLGVLAESTSRIGRRLYIYLAGHGIGFINPKGEVGLLMANAALRRPGYHIPGHAYADWFVTAGCFDEVVLLMDCCRTSLNMSPPAAFPCVPKLKSRPGLVKWFYGHATLPAATAREKPVGPGGEMRGLSPWHCSPAYVVGLLTDQSQDFA